MISKEEVYKVIETYEKAWVTKDENLIQTIFNKDATYHERIFENPFKGLEEIKAYWQSKVIGEQDNIEFKLLNLYLDGNTAIAEWEAKFDDKKRELRKHMIEVALLEFKGGKIQSLREYWSSKNI